MGEHIVASLIGYDVKALQGNLITLGYLPAGNADGNWGNQSKRALLRFQRRATNTYRISIDTGAPADCTAAQLYRGQATGVVDQAALDEVAKWLTKRWKAPLGRFAMASIGNGTLRSDVAAAWSTLVNSVVAKGGTLAGPYGDTKRQLGQTAKIGASSYSYHKVGRAIDIQQELSNPPNSTRRYFVERETSGGKTFWTIWCSTPTWERGTKFDKGGFMYWDFVDKKNIKAPEGCYMNLTEAITDSSDFERIPAQGGWESQYNKTEWWHFQWARDKQPTFQDECELVGISESDLRGAGYNEQGMDHKPG
jgi:Putative peptidoglycan binding domain